MSFRNQEFPVPIHEQVESESDSSEDSSFDSLDSEIIKIKEITSALSSDLTNKLLNYKRLHRVCVNQGEELSTKLISLKEQKKHLEPITGLKEKTCEINEKLLKAVNGCKGPAQKFSLNERDLQEILNSLQGYEEKEKYEPGKICANTSASQFHKETIAKIETEGKKEFCSCLVI